VQQKAYVNEALLKGYGNCTVACPSDTIKQYLFENEIICSEIDGLFRGQVAVEEGDIVCQN